MATMDLILKTLLEMKTDMGDMEVKIIDRVSTLEGKVKATNDLKEKIERNTDKIGKLADSQIECLSMLEKHIEVEQGIREYVKNLVTKRRWITTFVSNLIGTIFGFLIGLGIISLRTGGK